MKVKIKISQIDNGFILNLFDEEGPSELDETLFFEKFDDVLAKIKEWRKEA